MGDLSFRYAALTDVGLRRHENQDSGYASSRMLFIADGMGGAAAGDLASSTIANTLRQMDAEVDAEPREVLAGAIQRANDRLGDLIADDPSVEGMGTTLTALLFDQGVFTVAHIGDSRAYRLRGGELTQITKDHTFVQTLVDEGSLTAAEAREHPHKSLILRALLGRADNEADLYEEIPQVGDRYLLCSDGLSDMVTDADIAQFLGEGNVDQAAVSLVTGALEMGGVDNVTVIVAEIVAADSPVDPELSCANGQPQLVGAAAKLPRPRTGNAPLPSGRSLDDEELRYAPGEGKSGTRTRWLVIALGFTILLIGAGWAAYTWSQDQYFVADFDGEVSIYRGVQTEVPFIDLSSLVSQTGVETATLPPYNQQLVDGGITAGSLDEAQAIVDELRGLARIETIEPNPSPSPSPSPQISGLPSPSPSS